MSRVSSAERVEEVDGAGAAEAASKAAEAPLVEHRSLQEASLAGASIEPRGVAVQSSTTTPARAISTTYTSGVVGGSTLGTPRSTAQMAGAMTSEVTRTTYEGHPRSLTTSTSYGGSRIVTGEERVIGYNTLVGEDRTISERVVEHTIAIPKKVVREERYEKVLIVPETVIVEEIVEETVNVQEVIITVEKVTKREKVVEQDETEYIEKIVETVQPIVQEKVREVPVVQYVDRIVEIPKIVEVEKVVEVPEIVYVDVPMEKTVEYTVVEEKVVTREVQGPPRYVDKPVPEYVNVEVPVDVQRNIPQPVEAITTFEYQLAQFRPRVNKILYPLYVPRFVEVPVSAELFDAATVNTLNAQAAKLQILTQPQAVGLCDVENMATDFRRTDISQLQTSAQPRFTLP